MIDFYVNNGNQTARYVSSLMVREESLVQGIFSGLYGSSSGQVAKQLPVCKDSPNADHSAFELEIDGFDLSSHWNWTDAIVRDGKRGTREGVIKLRHSTFPADVAVVTRLDDTQVLVRYLEITNTGTSRQALSHVAPLAGLLWNNSVKFGPMRGDMLRSQAAVENEGGLDQTRFSLGYLDSNRQGQEGDFIWKPLSSQAFRLERNKGHAFSPPDWILRNEMTGELFFLALAWSGSYFAEFSNHEDVTGGPYEMTRHEYPCLSFRAGPAGYAPLRMIDPGETVISPEIHFGLFHSEMDQAVDGWHEHLRRSVIPPRPEGKEPFVASGRVVEEPGDWILREIDIASEMGAEGFMVDAGWYGGKCGSWWSRRGDWYEGEWLPKGGLVGIRDYVHGKGMLFGLWQEPEAATFESETAAYHPEWIVTTREGGKAENLNLANPEAARYFADSVEKMVGGYNLDYYKLDYNAVSTDQSVNRADKGYENETWRHNEVVYRTYDHILEKYPGILLENCASGGGRNDLGMLSRFHYCCESDFSFFPNSIRAINAMTLFLPPEALCYYHNHLGFAHETCGADTHLRAAMFCLPVFVGFGAQDTDRNSRFFMLTKRYIELFKKHCKPVLANHPVVFHHTPDIGLIGPAEWCVLEYARRDGAAGYAGIFRTGGKQGGSDEYVFKPRGIDPSKNYHILLDNKQASFDISGRELTIAGIPVRIESVMSSELIIYQITDTGA